MADFTELKQRHRAVWASGDYDQIAQTIQAVADHVVRSARIRPGERVLDIACGTGNTALMARARGATVTGLDLTPELLTIAHRRAAEAEYGDITWKEGDAESLPFPEGTFDVVVSSCGLMFAPDQQRVAKEVARVTRHGGRIAIQAWTRRAESGASSSSTTATCQRPQAYRARSNGVTNPGCSRCLVRRLRTIGSNATTVRSMQTRRNRWPICSSSASALHIVHTMPSNLRRQPHFAKA